MNPMVEGTDSTAQQLSNPEKRFLLALGAGTAWTSLDDKGRFPNDSEAARAASWLQAKKLIDVKEEVAKFVSLDEEGRRYAATGLPEARVYDVVAKTGPTKLSALPTQAGLTNDEVQIALRWWKRKGLGGLERAGSDTVLTANATRPRSSDETALGQLRGAEALPLSAVDAAGLELLKGRQGVVRVQDRKTRSVRLTDLGRRLVSGGLVVEEEIGQLTPELIRSGTWKGKTIRPYDVATPAPRTHAGKP
ncbi:MAG TPA: hypothetical protein VI818_07840, partial [Candidatus Thermoplasmatota archaeon]|nr:hypothetical protein [Candidatus Thermoplasmatota archaeon]